MYASLAIFLVFALLLVLNLLGSTAAAILWRVFSPFVENWSAQRRARAVFALRVFPFVGALIFVFAFLLPAYFLFEPRRSGEVISLKLALLALISAVGMLVAFYRVFGTWWKTRRLVSNWLADAERTSIAEVKIPVFRINHQFPVIAVVGTFRPRMFIASQVFDLLEAEEFRAVIAHECGHLIAYDNFKRTILRVCRDLLIVPFGKTIDRIWAETAESAADEFAAQNGGNQTALNLAAALVKIARVVPPDSKPAMPAGAFLLTEQIGDVTFRVQYLLQLAEVKLFPAKYRWLRISLWLYSACLLIVGLLVTNYNFLEKIHDLLEGIVRILQ